MSSGQIIRVRLLHVHDLITHSSERLHGQGRSEEVSKVLCCLNVGNLELPAFHELAYIEVSAVDVLRLLMMFRIISQVDRPKATMTTFKVVAGGGRTRFARRFTHITHKILHTFRGRFTGFRGGFADVSHMFRGCLLL